MVTKPTRLALTLSPAPASVAHIEVLPDGERVQHGRKITDTLRIHVRGEKVTQAQGESLLLLVRRVLMAFLIVDVQTDAGMKPWVREHKREMSE